jgi:hypothetical protein
MLLLHTCGCASPIQSGPPPSFSRATLAPFASARTEAHSHRGYLHIFREQSVVPLDLSRCFPFNGLRRPPRATLLLPGRVRLQPPHYNSSRIARDLPAHRRPARCAAAPPLPAAEPVFARPCRITSALAHACWRHLGLLLPRPSHSRVHTPAPPSTAPSHVAAPPCTHCSTRALLLVPGCSLPPGSRTCRARARPARRCLLMRVCRCRTCSSVCAPTCTISTASPPLALTRAVAPTRSASSRARRAHSVPAACPSACSRARRTPAPPARSTLLRTAAPTRTAPSTSAPSRGRPAHACLSLSAPHAPPARVAAGAARRSGPCAYRTRLRTAAAHHHRLPSHAPLGPPRTAARAAATRHHRSRATQRPVPLGPRAAPARLRSPSHVESRRAAWARVGPGVLRHRLGQGRPWAPPAPPAVACVEERKGKSRRRT